MPSVDMRSVGLGVPFGTSVDGYRLVSYVGAGGNGIVYAAENQRGERFALKFLLSDDESKRKLFRHEYDLLKEHHICSALPHVYDYGVFRGKFPYFSMELLASFDSQLKSHSHTAAELDEFVGWFMGLMCEAVKRLHDIGIYHRDIKLDNIMWRTLGSPMPVLIDFGIAYDENFPEKELLENYLKISGTPGNAAPEQFAGKGQFRKKEILQATDVYAFGNLIAACFSTGEDNVERRQRGGDRHPVTPPQWVRIESVCRAIKWWDRYRSIADVQDAVVNRTQRYRDWIGTVSAFRDSAESQKRVDRVYAIDASDTKIEKIENLIQDGCIRLKGRTFRVICPVRFASAQIIQILGPGRLELDADGERGSVLVVRSDAVVVNTATDYSDDGLIYCLLEGCLHFPELSSEHMSRDGQRVFNVRSLGAQVFYGKNFKMDCPNLAQYLGETIRAHIGEESWKHLSRILPMDCLRRESMTAMFKKFFWDKESANSREKANRILCEMRRRIQNDERLMSNAGLSCAIEKLGGAMQSATPDGIDKVLDDLRELNANLAAGKYLGPLDP